MRGLLLVMLVGCATQEYNLDEAEPQTICLSSCYTNYDCWDACGGASNTACSRTGPGYGHCVTLTAPKLVLDPVTNTVSCPVNCTADSTCNAECGPFYTCKKGAVGGGSCTRTVPL